MTTRLPVTLEVSPDEVRDVLAFYSDGVEAVKDATIRRYLTTIYDPGVPVERREAFRDSMRVGLRYCVWEIESGRAGQLRKLLDGEP